MNWTTLVSAEQLATALDAPDPPRVIDARAVLGNPDAGAAAWRASRIPGALHVDLERDLSDHRKPASAGRHPLPDAETFSRTLGRLGISPDDQVVVYDAAEGAMAAARFWWMLRLLGHRRVAVLDGGFSRWTALGLRVETCEPVETPRANFGRAHYASGAVVETSEVLASLSQDGDALLIDARAGERFRGEVEPLDRIAGHIPGARSRPFAQNMDDGRFLPPSVLREHFLALLGDTDPARVVHNCGSGVTACHNLLAMEHAGLAGSRVYGASWSGWSSDAANPVETGP
jgi:thiosulfate/3-mercaptopyruvate sulfurtransferase